MTNLNLELKAKTRIETGKKVNRLREQGKIPAVLYGHKIKSVSLVLDYVVFEKVFKQAGESTLIDLVVDDKEPVKVLVQDYQLNPTTNQFIHVDFHRIKMDEKLHTEIELEFVGEPPAVKELNGVLVTSLDKLEVECLPQHLVHKIKVDISTLETLDSAIHISDIKIPEGITILNVPEDVVILIQPPRTEKELEELEVKPEEEVIEGEEGEVKEGEEGEEGEVKEGEVKPEEEADKGESKNKQDK